MKTKLLTMVALQVLAVPMISAQMVQYGPNGVRIVPYYNAVLNENTELSFTGFVSGTSISAPTNNSEAWATMLVRTPNGGTAIVDMGPAWFINSMDIFIGTHDYVRVRGFKVMVRGRGLILATDVTVNNDQSVSLRYSNGDPIWDAFRMNSPSYFAPIGG